MRPHHVVRPSTYNITHSSQYSCTSVVANEYVLSRRPHGSPRTKGYGICSPFISRLSRGVRVSRSKELIARGSGAGGHPSVGSTGAHTRAEENNSGNSNPNSAALRVADTTIMDAAAQARKNGQCGSIYGQGGRRHRSALRDAGTSQDKQTQSPPVCNKYVEGKCRTISQQSRFVGPLASTPSFEACGTSGRRGSKNSVTPTKYKFVGFRLIRTGDDNNVW